MRDTRTCLGKGTILQLDKEYVIQGEIGRGASCLVYDGYYIDSGRHRVRIKECFPCHIEARRDSEGRIVLAEGWEGRFEDAKRAFSDAYRRNNELRNREGFVNATIDSRWMHKKNNTVYFVMGYMEGVDYWEFTESCLKDIFTRMKRLCSIIGGYHKSGCLLLDMKPGNILIPSDTKEQIVLFDFDSLVEIKDLKEGKEVRVSYSDGFSAPEVAQGDLGNIGMTADVYSVGAVIFYKIFGKTPGVWDQTWGAAYDFSAMAFLDGRYQPKLFSKLTEFFHKTLSAAVLRYQTMEEVIAALEGLERISDVEGAMLLNNFSYKFSQFVGRRKELLQIQEKLEETDVVFLSGMGGIGKTELAKKFANQYRSQFNRVVFLRFADTIMETICSEDLMIAGCDAEKQEPLSGFYARKLASLRQNASNDDLIILDNFDRKDGGHAIEEDAHLNDLLNCGCKILATTREDFWGEYGYAQIGIGALKDGMEYRELFQRNNNKEYPKEEWEAVERLFHLFEGHLMTVALLAKYLLHTEQAPSALLRQMEQKEGIISAQMPPVRHNKDDMPRERKIYAHLQVLFDLSGFTELETEIMGSLSLLGPIRIKKPVFVQYFKPCSGVEEHLEGLIRHGWVEEDAKADKISLHQIILDLAYHSLNPTSESCPHITCAMAAYFKEEENSRIQRDGQRKLAEYFIDRIGGADFPLAELYYAYCRHIKEDGKILERARQICKGVNSYESNILLVKISHIEISSLIGKAEWLELEDEEQMEAAFHEVYGQVSQLEKDIFANIRNAALPQMAERKEIGEAARGHLGSCMEDGHSLAPYADDSLVRLFLETAGVMEDLANRICEASMLLDEPAFSGLIGIYHDAEQIYLYASKIAEQEFISYGVKEDVYKKMIEFYAEDDFSCLYRCAYVGDQGKCAYYSEKLHAVRAILTDGEEIFHSSEISYIEAAHQAKWDKRYEDAISLCQKALEKKEWFIENIQCEMGEAYIGLHEYGKAEALLLEGLRAEEAEGGDVCGVLEKIVELYELQKMGEEAAAYCGRIVQSQARLAEEGDRKAAARALVFGIKKAKWEGGGKIQLKETEYVAWDQYFQMLDACQDPERLLVSAYCEYAKYCWEIDQPEQALVRLFSAAEKYRKGTNGSEASRLYESIIGDGRFQEIRKDLYIRALLREAEFLCDSKDEAELALSLCRQAEGLLKEGAPDLEYLEALLKKTEADIYQYSREYYDYGLYRSKASQCDYYLLAERALQEQSGLNSAFEEWKEAAGCYLGLERYGMAKQCLGRMEMEAEKEGKMPCFLTYYSMCFEWVQMCQAQEELPVYTKALYRRLAQYIHCNTERADGELCLRALEMVRDNAFAYKGYGAALYAGLLSVPILLGEEWPNGIEAAEELPEEEAFCEDYIRKAEEIFPEKVGDWKLDGLIRLIEGIMAGIEGHAGLEGLYAALGRIEEKYRTAQIDFKR